MQIFCREYSSLFMKLDLCKALQRKHFSSRLFGCPLMKGTREKGFRIIYYYEYLKIKLNNATFLTIETNKI